ncbi:tRNA dihydrouridine synthase [Candidatus Latescibacterota bacterium]
MSIAHIINNKLILAPLAGILDLPERLTFKQYGCGLTCIGAIDAQRTALSGDGRLINIFGKEEHTLVAESPVSIQLIGAEPDDFLNAVTLIEQKADIIDINLGCPLKQVMKKGWGAALLKNPPKIFKIIQNLRNHISKPVTAKVRIGLDNENINIRDLAKCCEDAGASGIIVHARTVKQGFSGKTNWGSIAEIKKSVQIPVIGNGGVQSYKDVKLMLSETGCDSVMIGSAAMMNPFIFQQSNYYMKTQKTPSHPSFRDKVRFIRDYVSQIKTYQRNQFPWIGYTQFTRFLYLQLQLKKFLSKY